MRKGAITIENQKFGVVEIGFSSVKGFQKERGTICIGNEGKVIFDGRACLGAGTLIRVDRGILRFGNHFSSNNNCFFSCTEGITIGDDVLIGWNVNIRDSDGHTMYHDEKEVPSLKTVKIGNHVWIASYVDILKGVYVPDGSVIAYRSCLTKPISERNSLIAGYPAKIVRTGIEWER